MQLKKRHHLIKARQVSALGRLLFLAYTKFTHSQAAFGSSVSIRQCLVSDHSDQCSRVIPDSAQNLQKFLIDSTILSVAYRVSICTGVQWRVDVRNDRDNESDHSEYPDDYGPTFGFADDNSGIVSR